MTGFTPTSHRSEARRTHTSGGPTAPARDTAVTDHRVRHTGAWPTLVPATITRRTVVRRTVTPAAVAALVATLAACGSGSTPAAAPTSTSHAPARSISTPSAPSTSATPSPLGDVSHADVALWLEGAQPRFREIDSALGRAGAAVRNDDRARLHTACTALHAAVSHVADYRPAPDRIVRRHLRRALHDFDAAATDCLALRLDKSGALVTKGHQQITIATRRIGHLTG